jgi:phosphoglycerate dehydrogenase-like enzyme
VKPSIAVLNPTCLEIAGEHRAWVESRGAILRAEPAWGQLQPSQVDEAVGEAQAVVLPAPALGRQALNKLMARHLSLRVYAIAASGYDWLDVEEATRQGVLVTNSLPQEGAEVVADLAWGLLLAAARQLPHHHRLIQQGGHTRGIGVSAWGKTLGIVGLGRIGQAMARRARGFEMRVLAATPRPDRAFAAAYGVEVVDLDDLLRRSDFVSLHARLNEQTRGMIGARELALMKTGAILINTARRELVVEAALEAALLAGHLGGAGLDDPPTRPDSSLLHLPGVVFAPHLGNRAVEGIHAVFRGALECALDALEGRRPAWVVNPQVYTLPADQRRFALH